MITIDKTDTLYKYLFGLSVDNIDEEYQKFAKLGRYRPNDIQSYLREQFQLSLTNENEESDLESILDYYIDLKQLKTLPRTKIDAMLKEYETTHSKETFDSLINVYLKDVMHMACNYHTYHKDINIQDLIQISNMGLITALERYKSLSKIPFKDYLVYYINEKINEEFKEKQNG